MSPLLMDDYRILRERCEGYRGTAFKMREALRECADVLSEAPKDALNGVPRDVHSTAEVEAFLHEAAEAWRAMNDAYAALTEGQRAIVAKPLASLG